MSATLPPFRRIPWPARDIETVRRPDGTVLMRSRVPLDPYPEHVPSLLRRWGVEAPGRTWLAQRRGPGRAWHRLSYGEALAAVDAVSQALIDLGLGPGRPVMILSGNSLEHALLTMAAMQVGAPAAPVSPAYSLVSRDHAKLRHVFGLVEPKLVFVQDGPPFDRALAALELRDAVVVHVERPPTDVPSVPWSELVATRAGEAVAARLATVGPETVGKLLFTSGSTGMPKAVPNTQRMMCANLTMYLQCRPRDPSDPPPELLDWLPWNHTMGGNALFHPALADGGTLHVDDGRPVPGQFDETLRNLREISPTYMSNVPAAWAMLATALEHDDALARRFFARLRLMGYGGATLPDDLYRRLQALAIRHTGERIVMVTGWGCTETAPTATSTYWDTERVGLIGLPYPGVELKMVPVGGKYEMRIRGPIVMAGYHRQPELTAAAFDEEGYYRIGDAATFVDPDDPSQGLAFAGRVVEDFKLDSGTFVHVGTLRVAAIAAASPVVLDALVAGQDRPYVGLLAWPNLAACRALAGLPDADAATLARHPAVVARLRDGLRAMNASAGGSSGRVGRALLLAEPPSVDANEITDKGYVNQRAGLERRAADVDRLYAEPPGEDVIVVDPPRA
ncbi:MAG TPA: AMP-binding protein [Burkholderiaceae bacterium]|nr:AMP-binding protein [Burkholderiaceae bacterium]